MKFIYIYLGRRNASVRREAEGRPRGGRRLHEPLERRESLQLAGVRPADDRRRRLEGTLVREVNAVPGRRAEGRRGELRLFPFASWRHEREPERRTPREGLRRMRLEEGVRKDGRERRKADVQAEAGMRRTPFAFSRIMSA